MTTGSSVICPAAYLAGCWPGYELRLFQRSLQALEQHPASSQHRVLQSIAGTQHPTDAAMHRDTFQSHLTHCMSSKQKLQGKIRLLKAGAAVTPHLHYIAAWLWRIGSLLAQLCQFLQLLRVHHVLHTQQQAR
jgi:hypothetical protein